MAKTIWSSVIRRNKDGRMVCSNGTHHPASLFQTASRRLPSELLGSAGLRLCRRFDQPVIVILQTQERQCSDLQVN
jgi:hypothetical protein